MMKCSPSNSREVAPCLAQLHHDSKQVTRPNDAKRRSVPTRICVSHGQLYVAMSRATTIMNIKILVLLPNAEAEEEARSKNWNMQKKEGKGQG
jgi:hypothetical protein